LNDIISTLANIEYNIKIAMLDNCIYSEIPDNYIISVSNITKMITDFDELFVKIYNKTASDEERSSFLKKKYLLEKEINKYFLTITDDIIQYLCDNNNCIGDYNLYTLASIKKKNESIAIKQKKYYTELSKMYVSFDKISLYGEYEFKKVSQKLMEICEKIDISSPDNQTKSNTIITEILGNTEIKTATEYTKMLIASKYIITNTLEVPSLTYQD
jgi:hypothetical protein